MCKEKEFHDLDVEVKGNSLAASLNYTGRRHGADWASSTGLIQLRVSQPSLPDNIAAWNDWGRAARKACPKSILGTLGGQDMDWLARSSSPFLVPLIDVRCLGVRCLCHSQRLQVFSRHRMHEG